MRHAALHAGLIVSSGPVDAGAAPRVRAWLEGREAAGVGPRVVEAARRALATAGGVVTERHGTVVCFSERRRVLELDRHGTLLTTLSWRDDGSLDEAAVRLGDRSWILVEPRATTESPWGECDRLWWATAPRRESRVAEPSSVMTAVDWSHVSAIPTVATPARLPPGTGSAVLNLIATLARDAGGAGLVYQGPYPGEQLFLTLVESFTYTAAEDPLAAFVRGELRWVPAPHERVFIEADLHVQLREGVDAVTWRGRKYHRATWQSLERYAPRRVHDVGDRVRCSIWALGRPIEDHLELTRDGELHAVLPIVSRVEQTRDVTSAVVDGVLAAIAVASAPPLAAAIEDAGRRLHVTWGPVDRDLAAIDGDAIRFASSLRDAAVRAIAGAGDREARVAAAFALLGEMAGLLGDELRARAQRTLAELPEAEQAALLRESTGPSPETARAIGRAVEALLDELERPTTPP